MTPRQKRFIEEYLVDLNATQACIRAGFSRNGADVTGSRLIGNLSIKAAVAERMRARAEELNIDSRWFLKILVKIATADVAMETIKAQDVLRAVELIGKHLGFFEKEKLNMTDEELITRARQFFDPTYKKESNDTEIKRIN